MSTLKADLKDMYRAGKVTFPEFAGELASTVEQLGDASDAWQAQAFAAGSPTSLTRAVAINDDAYRLLRRAVLSWHAAATAIVAVADDYVATDERAAAAADSIGGDLAERRLELPPVPPARSGGQG
ncbi:hypothetical protein [Nocardioides speluncae]|uniref:hypothetical protein n=1 Tax=Nocardioides speluncae TaxID=2670337 RepID=UPI000D68DD97|nr:hypothetical protein [Nocardioides speluncae]